MPMTFMYVQNVRVSAVVSLPLDGSGPFLHNRTIHLSHTYTLQTVFHPPFNPFVTVGLVVSVVTLGFGSMQFGFSHQQYKQGYWK